MRPRLVALIVFALACVPAAAQEPPTAAPLLRVESCRPESGLLVSAASHGPLVVLRSCTIDGRPTWLAVDPGTLATMVVPAGRESFEPLDRDALRVRLATTAYGLALDAARGNARTLVDAGLTHLRPSRPGINLTIDLCPSKRPLDRRLFLSLLTELEAVVRPVPVAVAVTGAWLRGHEPDLDWLTGLVRDGRLDITWVNHSDHHAVDPAAPLASNFMLEPGTDVDAEVLGAERALLERGLVPSVFFRFPGLVSSPDLVEAVVRLGLVPLGSDAWLAKGERPTPGSVVLVHGNGNEPLGVRKFIELLHARRPDIRERKWLLLDLRESVVETGRQSAAPAGQLRAP